MIKPRKPWKTVDDVEYATAEWVDWFNHRRLYEQCGHIPPVEAEDLYYAHQQAQQELQPSNQQLPGLAGAVHCVSSPVSG